MNTTKLKNVGNISLFVSWVLGIALMVIGSLGYAGWDFLVLVIAIALSVLLNSKYESKVVKGIEDLQKEVNELNSSLTLAKSKASEWEGKYDKASSDLADYKTKAQDLQTELDALKAAAVQTEAESASTEEVSVKTTSKKSKKK